VEIAPIDDTCCLYVASDIDDWDTIRSLDIKVVIDLEGAVDHGVPTVPGTILYIYLPLHDDPELPNLIKLRAVARLAADLHRQGLKIVSHCGMGLNRSALMAGLILHELGWSGRDAIARLRERRTGALYNEVFHDYLLGLMAEEAGS
jgi:protein-tyrosine phosphatase